MRHDEEPERDHGGREKDRFGTSSCSSAPRLARARSTPNNGRELFRVRVRTGARPRGLERPRLQGPD
jgi:hypothetical protein